MGERRRTSLRHFRRTACTAALVVTALGTVANAQEAAPAPEFNRGTGNALAQGIRVNPVAGGLSFGVGIGEALAGHQNTGATAEARSANLGVIGTTLSAEGCDGGDPTLPAEQQPQALRVQSNEEGAADGRSGQDRIVPGIDREVRATTDPYAEALVHGGTFGTPGAFEVQGFRSFSSSGVIDGAVREARAVVEIGRLVVAGVVELEGLRWEAVHRSGGVDEQIGTFTMGDLRIAGVPVPFDDPTAAMSQANDLLRTIGLELRPPRYHLDETSAGTLATVDPLAIRVIPAEARDGLVGPVLSQLQPVREDLFQALIDADCSNATFITVLDIVLSAFGPGGYLGIELGGVQAGTAEITGFTGLGQGGALPPLASAGPASGTTGGSAGGARGGATTGAPTTPAAAPPAGDTGGGSDETALDDAVDAAATSGTRGGALAAVAGTGLLLLLATAEGDRRKMRRAQRTIPLEA